MEVIKELTSFYKWAAEDHRLGPTHISLYMALFQCWNLNGFRNPVCITRKQLMKGAHISGKATYHRVMKQLQEYGYIQYRPSFDPGSGSQVFLLQ